MEVKEEETVTEETETKEKKEEEKPKEKSKLEEADDKIKEMRELKDQLKEQVDRLDKIQSDKKLAGVADAGFVPEKKKELSDVEYYEAMTRQEVDPFKADGYV